MTLSGGALYVPLASICDSHPYRGRLLKISLKTHRIVAGRSFPNRDRGSIWGWGGVSVDERVGRIFAATGNGPFRTQSGGYAEHVVSST